MATLQFANNATTTIAGAISNSATSVNLAPGSGARFPTLSAGQTFIGTFTDAATGLLTEIVQVTARSGDTLTIVRAQEGTTGLAWNAGDIFANLWTAGQASAMAQGAQIPQKQIFTSSGTFTAPAGITALSVFKFTVAGGGGGGGTATPTAGGGGGGAGAAIFWGTGIVAGNTVAVTVGAAGAASGNGGNSSIVFGATTVTANGGGGGGTNGAPGSAGTAVNGTVNFTGGAGGSGFGGAVTIGGAGGGSLLGGGGAPTFNSGSGVPGTAGSGFGGGGSGGVVSGGGGAGAAGIVIVEWQQ